MRNKILIETLTIGLFDFTISISKILTFTNFRGLIMYGSVYAKSSYK